MRKIFSAILYLKLNERSIYIVKGLDLLRLRPQPPRTENLIQYSQAFNRTLMDSKPITPTTIKVGV